jgi:acyl-CoA reductase-like NAD-dependent aldehyde dehydrogenase
MQPNIEAKANASTSVGASSAAPRIKPGFEWANVWASAKGVAPEAFGSAGFLNLGFGAARHGKVHPDKPIWGWQGTTRGFASPVDGSTLYHLPMLDLAVANDLVIGAKSAAASWSALPLEDRVEKVRACLALMQQQRVLLASLLMWEIGKPMRIAQSDVDRCISGVQWYCDHATTLLANRKALGLISNIASWNYPLSVMMHAMLVQALCGNAVIGKSPTDGGGASLALSCAFAAREGIPISLVSGSGGVLSAALVRGADVDCLSFVGGRTNGRDIAANLVNHHKRYMLEMEGLNAYGIWEFSDFTLLSSQIKKGFEYAKQRCTAYPRFVVQRKLFAKFLDAYTKAALQVRFGHPAMVLSDTDALPDYDFGPVINAEKASHLREAVELALRGGSVPLFDGSETCRGIVPVGAAGGAYASPVALLDVPRSSELYHAEPFGPIDSFVIVDTEEQLIAEMNVSNGCLVASIACDDAKLAQRLSFDLRSFKFGHNTLRSRGDRDELFGGMGQSWKGCFVGGALLPRAVTRGDDDDALPGNFVTHTRMPDARA